MKLLHVISFRRACLLTALLISARVCLAQITLDGANHCNSSANGVTTVSCTLSSVTAGDLITVEFSDRDGYVTGTADPHNGTYTQIYYSPDTANPSYAGMAYFANSASGSLTISLTLSSSGNFEWGGISVQAWKGAATTAALDNTAITQHLTSTSGTVANSSCGSAQTPSGAGELIIGYVGTDNDTSVSAGTNYTLIDTNTTTTTFPEYWIQTTSQSTNGPFTNAADDWIAGCAAFKPASGGGGAGITGSGTANTIPLFTGSSPSSTLTNSVIVQSAGNLGVGTNTPTKTLDLRGSAVIGAGNGDWGFNYGLQVKNAVNTTTSLSVWQEGIAAGHLGYLQNNQTLFLVNSPTTGDFTLAGHPFLALAPNGNVGIGTSNPQAQLEVNGALRFTTDGSIQTTAWTGVLCGGDYAEAVNASRKLNSYEPGDVLVLATDDSGHVDKSTEPYSTLVAGVYATKPGVIGRRQTLPKEAEELPMAMVGIVPTKVSAQNGPIHSGDLLVTSSLSGYAMKGTDRSRMLGAVIGKAMGSLESGTGVIEVLVTMQ